MTRTFSLAGLIAGYSHAVFTCPSHLYFLSQHCANCPHLLVRYRLIQAQASVRLESAPQSKPVTGWLGIQPAGAQPRALKVWTLSAMKSLLLLSTREIHLSQAFTSLPPLPFVARWKQMSSIHILSPAGFRYKTFWQEIAVKGPKLALKMNLRPLKSVACQDSFIIFFCFNLN